MRRALKRAPTSPKLWFFIGLLSWTSAVSVQAAPQVACDQIVVFGTSLSDPGNAFALLGGNNTRLITQ
jgi:hypothetical protein